ncbi:MAG TPA: SCO family protein [Acidobacteriaceae bacterium]|nr:SCO family protein [Nitrospira sp.]HEV2272881.1 SCO family protein [Acidobacteriaceae bacterium]
MRRPACFPGVYRTWTVFSTIVVACGLISFLSGCRGTQSNTASQETVLSGNVQTYQLKGVVVATDPANGEVSIDSEAIPGFMEAMTMPYKLAQANIAGELHPGDHITGRLRVSDTASQLDQIVVTAQAKPDYKPSTSYNVPKPGQPVPDFEFLNQDGRKIHLSQFHGQALVLTFIYTRCPLPEYCIRMTRNFAEIHRSLAVDPKLYDKTHLLSISFDPANDTPAVLRKYGSAYIGKNSHQAFSHWDFAAPPQSELAAVNQFFDVGVTPGENQTLTHSLSTVVIGPDGKIVSWYPTNDWKPEDVLKDLKQALAAAGGRDAV